MRKLRTESTFSILNISMFSSKTEEVEATRAHKKKLQYGMEKFDMSICQF